MGSGSVAGDFDDSCLGRRVEVAIPGDEVSDGDDLDTASDGTGGGPGRCGDM